LEVPSETIKDIMAPYRRTHSLPNQFSFVKRMTTNLETLPSDSFHQDWHHDTFTGAHHTEDILELNQTPLPRSNKLLASTPLIRPANPTAINFHASAKPKHKFVMTSTKDGGYFFKLRSEASLKTKPNPSQTSLASLGCITAPKHSKVSLSLSVCKAALRKMTIDHNKSNSTHRLKQEL
jgi:hypothetical protein